MSGQSAVGYPFVFTRVEPGYSARYTAGYQMVFTSRDLSPADSEAIRERVQCLVPTGRGPRAKVRLQYFTLASALVVITCTSVLATDPTVMDKTGREGIFLVHGVALKSGEFQKLRNNPFAVLDGVSFITTTEEFLQRVIYAAKEGKPYPDTLTIQEKGYRSPHIRPSNLEASWLHPHVESAPTLRRTGQSLLVYGEQQRIQEELKLVFASLEGNEGARAHCTFDTHIEGCMVPPALYWLVGATKTLTGRYAERLSVPPRPLPPSGPPPAATSGASPKPTEAPPKQERGQLSDQPSIYQPPRAPDTRPIPPQPSGNEASQERNEQAIPPSASADTEPLPSSAATSPLPDTPAAEPTQPPSAPGPATSPPPPERPAPENTSTQPQEPSTPNPATEPSPPAEPTATAEPSPAAAPAAMAESSSESARGMSISTAAADYYERRLTKLFDALGIDLPHSLVMDLTDYATRCDPPPPYDRQSDEEATQELLERWAADFQLSELEQHFLEEALEKIQERVNAPKESEEPPQTASEESKLANQGPALEEPSPARL